MADIVSAFDYQDACDNYMGWCPVCKDFTTSECEPDCEDRTCEQCDATVVVGAENALIMDMITVDEDEEQD